MGVENVMYFVLGVLVAGLLALTIMPAVWRRAVRLTKKRIEAATPMTMAEFRADKDQLRAEFALATRRLEMNVEQLRKRLAEQLKDINRKKTDLSTIKSDRDTHLSIIRELEEREGELRKRVQELERESAEAAQKLRMRERELNDKSAELTALRSGTKVAHPPALFDGAPLSGDYDRDTAQLLGLVGTERSRVADLTAQLRELSARLESADRRAMEANAVAAQSRTAARDSSDTADDVRDDLATAEARIAEAEARYTDVLAETSRLVTAGEERAESMLADKLKLEADLEVLRTKVRGVETAVMGEWSSDRIDQSHLRERLNDIAAEVSRLVYAVEGGDEGDGETLFDRVQRFADDGVKTEDLGPRSGKQPAGAVTNRMEALRELHGRD